MDGNKDEALRCIGIAKSALASGDKNRALKFIKIAQRLDSNLSVDDLLLACEGLDSSPSASSTQEKPIDEEILKDMGPKKAPNSANGVRDYTDENVELIREIKRHKDYYAILGVEKSCTVEEVRKAYRKLSLKVHPDKNKAPGSEEVFKMVSKAFKCLSDEESRRQYDQTGLIEEFEHSQQYNVRRRRRRRTTRQDIFDENIDPDEIFRSFFFGSQQEVFRNAHVYRSRGMGAQTGNVDGFRFNLMTLLQMLPFLFIFLVVYLPFSEPTYSLHKAYSYEIPKVTEKYGVEYFVKTSAFDQQFPPGSSSRANLENQVVREYRNMLGRYCHLELRRRRWVRNYPTPHCDKLQNFGAA